MGEAKNFHGMARARFRGLNKVEIQFLLTASALNLKKMVKMVNKGAIESSITKVFSYFSQILRYTLSPFSNEFRLEVS